MSVCLLLWEKEESHINYSSLLNELHVRWYNSIGKKFNQLCIGLVSLILKYINVHATIAQCFFVAGPIDETAFKVLESDFKINKMLFYPEF
jgi:hypothetical protein